MSSNNLHEHLGPIDVPPPITHVPVEDVLLRNPYFGMINHPHEKVKALVIKKVIDLRENDAVEQLVMESEIEPELEDVYLSTMIGADDRGYQNVINPTQRYQVIENFIRKGWKAELI